MIKATLHDKDGNILHITCDECDQEATCFLMGRDNTINFCNKHSPFEYYEAEWHYGSPSLAHDNEIPKILKDSWSIDLRKK